MQRVCNFNSGPAQLPKEVLIQVQNELLDWNQTGMSVMELPHRGDHFKSIALAAEQDLRELLSIPSNYHVLFLQGGGRAQFAMVPMNLAGNSSCMAYVDTGSWSTLALQEAQHFGDVRVVTSSKENNYTTIADFSSWDIPEKAAYLHYTDNETIHGLEFATPPNNIGDIPLVTDMSSNLLSKPIDVSQFGLIYACAQKNLGPAGITVVIIRDDLLERQPISYTPYILRYAVHAKDQSLYNTPATFSWYVTGLVFQWAKKQGGIKALAEINRRKAEKLYSCIDNSELYTNPVDRRYRSQMNVVFTLKNPTLDKSFLQTAEQQGLINIKGHRSVGGFRVGLYNAITESEVDKLIAFMNDFAQRNT